MELRRKGEDINKVWAVVAFLLVTLVSGFVLDLEDEQIQFILAIVPTVISVLAIYYSQKKADADVVLVKEDVEGYFLSQNDLSPRVVDSSKNMTRYIGGILRFSLLFHNNGEKPSLIKIKRIEIPNAGLTPVIVDHIVEIPGNTPALYEPKDELNKEEIEGIFFPNDSDTPPSTINLLKITYSWSRNTEWKEEKDIEIRISCKI